MLLGRARCCVVSVNLLEPDGFHNISRPLGGCGKYLRRCVRHCRQMYGFIRMEWTGGRQGTRMNRPSCATCAPQTGQVTWIVSDMTILQRKPRR